MKAGVNYRWRESVREEEKVDFFGEMDRKKRTGERKKKKRRDGEVEKKWRENDDLSRGQWLAYRGGVFRRRS